jgi:hypothetical protein
MPTQSELSELPTLGDSEISTNIVSCGFDFEWTRSREENTGQTHIYKVIWKVQTNSNGLTGVSVLYQLRLLQEAEITFDWIPRIGWYYGEHTTILGAQDPASFCNRVFCEIIDHEDPSVWRVAADYGPVVDIGTQIINDYPLDQDPMKWPLFRWFEIIDDQEVIEEAHCLGIPQYLRGSDVGDTIFTGTFLDLESVERGPNFPGSEPGPIVNAAGQQTVDPQMELSHRIIYNVKVNYPNEHYAMVLNRVFEKTVHGPEEMVHGNPLVNSLNNDLVPFIMGWPHGTWRFLVAIPEIKEWRVFDESGFSVRQYCSTTIKFEIKRGRKIEWGDGQYYSGWNRLILNNGQACFRRFSGEGSELGDLISHPKVEGRYLLFPTQAWKRRDGKETINEEEVTEETFEDITLEKVDTSEPINLRVDGTQLEEQYERPDHIWYQNLEPANYFHIAKYYGKYSGENLVPDPVLPGQLSTGFEDDEIPPDPTDPETPWKVTPTFP